MSLNVWIAPLMAGLVSSLLLVEPAWEPARYRSGPVPLPPQLVVGGGIALLELGISSEGTVSTVRPLRSTEPFTNLIESAVRSWVFDAAVARRASALDHDTPKATAVASKALVAAVFRPPALTGPTLGQPPVDVGSATDETPFPLATVVPPFPPQAHSGGSVLVELHVDPNGVVTDAVVVAPSPPFDAAATAAARQWRFRPALVNGVPSPALVYVVFGFPSPVMTTAARPRGPDRD